VSRVGSAPGARTRPLTGLHRLRGLGAARCHRRFVTRTIAADYLVMGAGALWMAFTDALTGHADVRVALVDRQSASADTGSRSTHSSDRTGPAFYGVASTLLGGGLLQQRGPEKGLQRTGTKSSPHQFGENVGRLSACMLGRAHGGCDPRSPHERECGAPAPALTKRAPLACVIGMAPTSHRPHTPAWKGVAARVSGHLDALDSCGCAPPRRLGFARQSCPAPLGLEQPGRAHTRPTLRP
jgi:hypothetical protein